MEDAMDIAELKALVDKARKAYDAVQHREWDGRVFNMSQTAMWAEASKAAPEEWREVVRVLAQGGDYYGIEW